MTEAMVILDLHGLNTYQAGVKIDAQLRRSRGVYRIRVIHGYRSGTALRDFVTERYADDPRILRMVPFNAGTTDLVLREL